MVKSYQDNHHIINKKIDLEFAAFDDENLIGGVYGYLQHDYLYISILWVKEAYRGKNIANQLMDLIEEEAHKRDYKIAYLGTCTFQAQGFYLKRNYIDRMIFHNCPENYDDFMMVKKI